jgi:hypothetical protein
LHDFIAFSSDTFLHLVFDKIQREIAFVAKRMLLTFLKQSDVSETPLKISSTENKGLIALNKAAKRINFSLCSSTGPIQQKLSVTQQTHKNSQSN